ncbi:polysaccharide deacetylase family protein [Mycolicibacterium komossense]|uniref:Polysaccharide deacetylase family protein n=1 Tax=Mycolicibacterium komossense TaxID=1779 RepID=A0ABT3CCF2_9MYCO|nr:polysaccharide deacetylase family protein [Mycolicibacterium komossense]MCV7227180.1 polysaccharide deacetylase family protein [Mycolicibacterium komossense]
MILSPPGAVVLAYHDILPNGHEPFQYAVSLNHFRLHLDLLSRLRFAIVPLSEITRRHRDGRSLRGLATVMFDDAIIGVHQLAISELTDRRLPWTLAVVTDRLGVEPQWWPGSRRTMTRQELDDAVAAGAELAVHTETHCNLTGLDDQELDTEIRRSRRRLEDWTGKAVTDVVYPGGCHTLRVRTAAREAGFEAGYSFTNGRVGHAIDPFMLPRLTMHDGMTAVPTLRSLLRPAFTWPRLATEMLGDTEFP